MDPLELRKKLDALLNDMEKLNRSVVGADGTIREFTVEEQTKFDGLAEERKKIEAALRRAEEIEESRGYVRSTTAVKETPSITVTRAENHDEKGNYRGFKTAGEQLRAVAEAATSGRVDKRLEEIRAASGMNTTVDQEGGFLIQSDFMNIAITDIYSNGVLASKCRQINTSSNANRVTLTTLDESSRATGSRYGGVVTYWRSEAANVASSKLKFKEQTINLESLMSMCYATEESLQDAPLLESTIMSSFVADMSWVLDDSILNGDGAGKPLGIIKSPALQTVPKESGQGKTVVRENVSKMRNRYMTLQGLTRAEWYVNQELLDQFEAMYVPLGSATGLPLYAPAGQFGIEKETLYRRPINPIEQALKLGDKGDLYFLDLNEYALVRKGTIASDQSIHVRFEYAERAFRFMLRVGGQPLWSSAITPANATSGRKVSPYVTLEAR